MNRVAAAAGVGLLAVAVAGASLVARRRRVMMPFASGPPLLTIITPMINLRVAELVLSILDKVPGDDVNIVLHTQGGCVASCVMISKALQRFPGATAIVPYMAISGGTLIALNAAKLKMGRDACLTAVDPIVSGTRAKHIGEGSDEGLQGLAREYERSIRTFLRSTLEERIANSPGKLDQALEVFMGMRAPHEWPVSPLEVRALGIPVDLAPAEWAALVDSRVRGW